MLVLRLLARPHFINDLKVLGMLNKCLVIGYVFVNYGFVIGVTVLYTPSIFLYDDKQCMVLLMCIIQVLMVPSFHAYWSPDIL